MSQNGINLSAVSKSIEEMGDSLPPLDKWNPEFCGDIDMRINREGEWFYQGSVIQRLAMVKLFARVLWLEEGKYFLKTPVEKVGIQVDDAPFIVTAMQEQQGEKGPELVFTTSTGDQIIAGKQHPIEVFECATSGEPSPYIEVRFGMKGLIHRNVFYQLVELAREEMVAQTLTLVIESQGEVFKLGELA